MCGFVVGREQLFLRNICTIDDLKVMGVDTIEKYSEILERLLNLFPVMNLKGIWKKI